MNNYIKILVRVIFTYVCENQILRLETGSGMIRDKNIEKYVEDIWGKENGGDVVEKFFSGLDFI